MKQSKKASILVVDDDHGHRSMLETIISGWGYLVETVDDGKKAVGMVEARPFDLILMDVRMATMDGIEALGKIKNYNPSIPVLIMTAYSSVESAVRALKAGAYDYLTKPLDFDKLKISVERALEHTRLKTENLALKEKLGIEASLNIIGKSRPMKELMDMVSMVAPSDATVLITGESGTGKELIARAIHRNSRRKDRPLVTVNCAALTETLLESELFGHEKGAFTGADRRREGRFMQANGGTIFLDEIGEMSLAMQAKLLRVIQEKEIQRVGSDSTLRVDVRIVAATNRDLKDDVAEGKFRQDLFYRLSVVVLNLPPLRERPEDIPLLAQHFLDKYAKRHRKMVKGFTPSAMDMLVKHEWPGNVRELENAVERAVILLQGEYVTERELPISIPRQDIEYTDSIGSDSSQPEREEPQSLEEVERRTILRALKASRGNKSAAARRLGITRRTLYKKLEKYNIRDW